MRAGLALGLALTMAAPVRGETVWQPGAAFVEATGAAPQGQGPARPAWPIAARFSHPTDRYVHDIMGGIPPWTVLAVQAQACGACRDGAEGDTVILPANLVFEDIAPRLWDVTGDGRPEVVVVETHVKKGARLAVWALSDKGADLARLAATAFIGRPQRWLAPVGVGDFDGDGRIEIAYVDRPHLARELVFVRLEAGRLREIARLPGFSGHRIGDTVITSAVRTCDGVTEVLVPDGDWARLVAVRLNGGKPVQRDAGTIAALIEPACR